MNAAAVMVPCISGATCHFDWIAIAAVGGWAGAIATFVAAGSALWISTSDVRDRRRKEASTGDMAFVSLAPLLHRAQADMGSVANALIGDVPDVERQHRILQLVEGLDAQLQSVQEVTWKLEPSRASEMTSIVARARMVVRQVRRIGVESHRPSLLMTWAIRDGWIAEARASVVELLGIAEQSRAAGRES